MRFCGCRMAGIEEMKIKELKELLKEWPDFNEDGEPSEIWIETDNLISNEVESFSLLNSSDLLLIPFKHGNHQGTN